MPLEKVIEALRLKRYPGHNAVCSINFIYQRSFIENADYGTFRLVDLPSCSPGALYDLNFFMVERPEGWRISCEYKTDLYEADTVRRMLGHFQTLLKGIVANPDRPLSVIPLLTDAERRQALVEWNATDADYPRDKCVHEVFEAQAARTPAAIAVVRDDQQPTYGDLNAKANRLAHHLQGLGVRPGDRVAIGLERSIDLVVGQLAVLKCGAAYVPIDLSAPMQRQAFLIEDCAARIVLTTRGWVGPETSGLTRVIVDELALTGEDAGNLAAPVNSEALAYVMYTSGSTGQPKGVMIPHRAIGRLAINNGYADFQPADPVAVAADPAFDASTMEVLGALLNGARMVVIDRAVLLDPQLFQRQLEKSQVSVLWLTAGIFDQSLKPSETFSRLRYLIAAATCSIPASSPGCCRAARRNTSSMAKFPPKRPLSPRPRPQGRFGPADAGSIGRPISNTRITSWTVMASRFRSARQARSYQRIRRRPRLSEPAGADGGAVHRQSVREKAIGCTGPETSAAIGPDGNIEFLGPQRFPGEDPRLPDRAGRDRGEVGRAAGGARSGGAGARATPPATNAWWLTTPCGRGLRRPLSRPSARVWPQACPTL